MNDLHPKQGGHQSNFLHIAQIGDLVVNDIQIAAE